MGREQLAVLTADDWALLAQGGRRASYRRGEVILAEGAQRRALFIVARGFVRVERGHGGGGITVAQLGPGEIFGEMSFLEESGASASVIAREDVDVDVVEDLYLHSLLSSTPAFAVRFYQSLAINLSRRLRKAIQRLADAAERAEAPAQRLRIVRTGDISARQIPQELRAAMASFDAAMARVDQQLADGSLPAGAAQDRVRTACDELVRILDQYTQDASLVEIGWDDLLAFRDTPQLASGVGDYIFRKTFSTIMLSATMARCYA
ncbi:MAG TPA: cyclic nucleotide-binding domain-containing protein, partial [Chloroflexota bacterium]|nr:cyclic nucleotide-binding domain-containing protein [Chloroflexota bacterium]